MKKYVPILAAFLVGGLGGYVAAMNPVPADHSMSSMKGEMDAMTAGLADKHGDEFDQAFLTEMIVHHEGAVEMAEAALQHARHQELRDMADDIITAQTAEIAQMKTWLNEWYSN